MVTMGGSAYIGVDSGGGYLWALYESGSMATLSGTAGMNANEMGGYGGTLFFSSSYMGYPELWTRNGSGVLESHSSMDMVMGLLDTFTGSNTYRSIFGRCIHPRFLARLVLESFRSLFSGLDVSNTGESTGDTEGVTSK